MLRVPLALILLLSTAAAAAPRPVPESKAVGRSSYAGGFIRAGSFLYFLASDDVHGRQLWRTDGTESGTVRASDFPTDIRLRGGIVGTIAGDVVFFRADDSLWRNHGTTTLKLGTITDLSLSTGGFAAAADDVRAFVLTQKSYDSPVAIWTADGLPGGLRLTGSFPVNLDRQPLAAGGKLYFAGKDDAVGEQLWVSDGTPLGTHMVRRSIECPGDSCNGIAPRAFFRIGTSAYFITAGALWRTDGTAEGTVQLRTFDQLPLLLGSSATTAYLRIGDAVWRTDGTAAGTRQVGTVDGTIYAWVLDDGRLLYSKPANGGYDLWTIDRKIATIPGDARRDAFVGAVGNRVLLAGGTPETGIELWFADLDSGAAGLVKDIDPRVEFDNVYSSVPFPGASLGEKIVFTATSIVGREPWVSDGTAAGTKLLANIMADPPTGSVSGTVRDAAGAPISGAVVYLCEQYCNDTAVTNADGRYRFDGFLPGTYTAVAWTFFDLAQSRQIDIAAGAETAGVDFALVRGGWISGSVRRAATGEPLADVSIDVRNGSGESVGRAYADGDGRYRTSALPAGTYVVEAHAGSSGDSRPVDQLYRGKDCPLFDCDWAGGTPVAVALGQETPAIDFALREYGTISGTLRDASDNAPVENVSVSFYRADDPATEIGTSSTDANGFYHSGHFLPGSYLVKFEGGNGYDAVAYPTAITLNIDSAVSGIDLRLPQTNGRVTGIVRDRAGAPFAGVTVAVRDGDHNVAWVTTDAAGRYTLFDIAPGAYDLVAFDDAVPVVVIAGKTLHADLQTRSQRTTISGRVTDAVSGAPIENAVVRLFDAAGQFVVNTNSDATGAYTIETISREPSMSVNAEAFGYHASSRTPVHLGTNDGLDFHLARRGAIHGSVVDALSGAPIAGARVTFNGADSTYTGDSGAYRWPVDEVPVTVAAGAAGHVAQTYRDVVVVPDGADVTVDFALQPTVFTGKIAGRVVDDATGAGVADVTIHALGPAEAFALTDANGNYTMSDLAGGDYSVDASGPPPYVPVRYGTPVIVAGLNTTAGIDFRLPMLRVTAVSPDSGDASGGTRVVIHGTSFAPGATVQIGGRDATVVSIVTTEIVVLTPAAEAPGAAHVTVTLPDGLRVTLAQAFTYTTTRRRAAR